LNPAATPTFTPPASEMDVAPAAPDPGAGGMPAAAPDVAPAVPTPTEVEVPDEVPDEPSTASGCSTPNGVNGRPTTLQEAVILMNTLPRPTTLACFLEALERPLQIWATRSKDSLQPAPGPESPRTFIVNAPLVMSIVFGGPASVTLELGYRSAPRRSIKTEIAFPLTRDVTFDNFFDGALNGSVTKCSACHTSETKTFNPELNIDVYESDIYEPLNVYAVDLETLRTARGSCDAAAEPARCALLGALFDHGDVVPAPEGIMFTP